MNGSEQLCPNCGLCCDSTLFADVELRAGDDAQRLAKHGLTVHPKTKTKLAFAQPCAGFDGRLCQIYADRPKRCKLFECGLLKRVEGGEMTTGLALKKISQARARAAEVRERLRQCGQRDESMALTHRYTAAMSAPVDLSVAGEAEQRGKLMLAVNDLMQMLERDFLR
jgi:Fe-S-cluster containining protein